jgi:hypothetical protein
MNNKNSQKITKPGPKCVTHQLENAVQMTNFIDLDDYCITGFDDSAVVYSTAVLTYLVNEILELAAQEAKNVQSNRINPRHLQLAIRGDEELDILLMQAISGGNF